MLRRTSFLALCIILISVFAWPVIGYANIVADAAAPQAQQPEITWPEQQSPESRTVILIRQPRNPDAVSRNTFREFNVIGRVVLAPHHIERPEGVKTIVIKVHSNEPSIISGSIEVVTPMTGVNLIISNERGFILNGCRILGGVSKVTFTTGRLEYNDDYLLGIRLESPAPIQFGDKGGIYAQPGCALHMYHIAEHPLFDVAGEVVVRHTKGYYGIDGRLIPNQEID